MDEINKSGHFQSPTPRRRDPTQQRKSTPRCSMSMPRHDREGGLDKPRVCRGVAKLRRDEGLRRSVALLTEMCFFSCFSIPLF